MIKIFIPYSLILALLITGCDSEKKQITHNSCSQQYKDYKNSISKYKIRMEDIVKKEGCEVIPVYASIIDAENFDILDAIDENPKLMTDLIKLFNTNKKFSSILFKNPLIQDIIVNNSLNKKFTDNFQYVVEKRFNKKEINKIEKNINYLNYALLASVYAKDKHSSFKLYTKLKSAISIELLPSFGLILNSVKEDYNFEEILESFSLLSEKLSSDSMKELTQYPQYFSYFLPPKKETFRLNAISSSKLREMQQNIQEKVIYIYKEMFEKYRYERGIEQIQYALLSIEYLYPYLLEEPKIETNQFKQLFHLLINKGYLLSLFNADKCSNKTQENFAVFGQNNIQNGINLLTKKRRLSSTLFSQLKDANYSIMSFFYVSNLYHNLNEKEWDIFVKLLQELPYGYDNKIAFIQRIEKNNYFKNIVLQDNYKESVDAEHGNDNLKFKYVLLTPYPSQNDMTLFETVMFSNISDKTLQRSLVDVIGKSIDELEKHEFTKSEKFFGNIEKVDTLLTVASIALIPFTGGTSLAYVATKVAVKQGSKKSAKYFMKKIALKSRKIINKGISKTRQVRKKIGKDKINKSDKHIDNISNGAMALTLGGMLYASSQNLETKKICQE